MPATTTPIAVLWRETVQRVDALPAFDRKRGHRVPDELSNGATAFVRRLAAGDVAREIEDCFQALRTQLGYKRRQLRVTLESDAAAIATPDFEFHLVVCQDPEAPGHARVRRTIEHVTSPQVVAAPAFAQAFADGFDGLDLTVGPRIDVGALIDRLEDEEPPGWTLDYGFEASALRLAHPDIPLAVDVTADRVRLVGPRPQPPALLLEAAEAALTAMGGHEALVAAG